MGYTTEFSGQFSITPKLTKAQKAFLLKFSETRRMKRDPEEILRLQESGVFPSGKKDLAIAAGLQIGPEGQHFVHGGGFGGQAIDESISGYNSPPKGQPGLWCHWVPTEDGKHLKWDGGEKFYDYVEWLEYIIERFLKPWGRAINGEVEYQGEDEDDFGVIVVRNNIVGVYEGVCRSDLPANIPPLPPALEVIDVEISEEDSYVTFEDSDLVKDALIALLEIVEAEGFAVRADGTDEQVQKYMRAIELGQQALESLTD